MTFEFDPDWTLAPAALLREWMDENGLSVNVLAVAAAGRARRDEAAPLIKQVLAKEPLHAHHADVLAAGTGIPARMWLNLERSYRDGLEAGKKDVTDG